MNTIKKMRKIILPGLIGITEINKNEFTPFVSNCVFFGEKSRKIFQIIKHAMHI